MSRISLSVAVLLLSLLFFCQQSFAVPSRGSERGVQPQAVRQPRLSHSSSGAIRWVLSSGLFRNSSSNIYGIINTNLSNGEMFGVPSRGIGKALRSSGDSRVFRSSLGKRSILGSGKSISGFRRSRGSKINIR